MNPFAAEAGQSKAAQPAAFQGVASIIGSPASGATYSGKPDGSRLGWVRYRPKTDGATIASIIGSPASGATDGPKRFRWNDTRTFWIER
jgi:hypothetical protein